MPGSSHIALALVCLLAPLAVRAEPVPPSENSILPTGLFDDASSAPQVIYRYRNAAGRTVFTNFEDTVPPTQRQGAEVDLSHVSLNTELGNEIDARMQEQHARLMDSGYCKSLRSEAQTSRLAYLWDEYAPLIVCGGMLLLFLAFTPVALRRVGAPVWAKTLTMAIPTLALAGVVMFSMTQANRMVIDLKQKVRPCVKETWDELADGPQVVAKHVQLVDQLKRQIQAVEGLSGPQGIDALQGLEGLEALHEQRPR